MTDKIFPPAITVTETKRRLIKIDLSEWELGNWPEELLGAISFEKRYGSIDISIDDKIFQPLIRKIIHEAISTYLEDACFELTEEGLQIQEGNNYTTEAVIAWDDMHLKTAATLGKIQKWAKEYISIHFPEDDDND